MICQRIVAADTVGQFIDDSGAHTLTFQALGSRQKAAPITQYLKPKPETACHSKHDTDARVYADCHVCAAETPLT